MAMDKTGKKGLTIGILMGKGKGSGNEEGPGENETETETEGEGVPPGLVEAMGELRSALDSGDDQAAAEAFKAAMDCC
jgi:hypothetical protein